MDFFQSAILKTLAYADIFDFPLTEQEIRRWLIGPPDGELKFAKKQPFYFLKGREKIVAVRKKREKESQKKFKIAKRVANWLKFIPTIKMVAITGALAMNNAHQDDDIDLLIVSQKNRLWLTRLMTVLLTEIIACRRHPADREFKDKICLNMFLDEAHLAVPKKEQDLFLAHEVCQLKPIWEKDGIYQKFIKENQWVRRFLPNWKP